MNVRNQPVPKVSDADVRRIVNRDFAEDQQRQATALLAQYGSEDWHREAARVRLAALKLAGGDLVRLRDQIELACRDYRDVLISAEYPEYHVRSMKGRFGRGERAAALTSDWEQYSKWLQRSSGMD